METIENQTFIDVTVHVDNKAFKNCTFNNTDFHYSAGAIPSFENCSFNRVSLSFDGAAQNSINFLSVLYQGGFEGSVENIFDTIRNGS